MKDVRHGLLLVDKPAGPTSHDVVQAARHALRQRRIGHTGTLDPAATGLLLLCVGRATRLQQYLLAWPKTYVGEIRLGFATTTYDAEGEPLGDPVPVPTFTDEALRRLAERFTGSIEQVPPPYSAKKHAGRKFYELARAGEEVPLEAKRVHVHTLALAWGAPDRLRFEVTCSSGTYVRSLAHDLGAELGCGGHLSELRRVRIGPWEVTQAVPAERLAQGEVEAALAAFVPLDEARLPFPEVTLNPTAAGHFLHGQEVVVREADGNFVPGGHVLVRARSGSLLGVAATVAYLPRARTASLAPRMVLGELETTKKP